MEKCYLNLKKKNHHYIEWEGVVEIDAVILIRFLLEEEAKDFYDTMSQEDKMDVNTIFTKLRERSCPRSFKLIVHERLCSDKQKDNETIDEFISRFNKMTQVIYLSEDQKLPILCELDIKRPSIYPICAFLHVTINIYIGLHNVQ